MSGSGGREGGGAGIYYRQEGLQIWGGVRGWEFVDMLIFYLKIGSIMVKKLQWETGKCLTSWSRDGWHVGE